MMRVKELLLCFSLLLLAGCREEGIGAAEDPYLTWDLKGDSYPSLPDVEMGRLPEGEAFPVAGIVSHHLLAGELIDDWFRELARRRKVERFFILSPRHWDLGTGDYSLTAESWLTARGKVKADGDVVDRLAEELDCEVDREVFVMEHGIETLIPFIKKYFPDAKVVPLNYRGEAPVNMPVVNRLWKSLSPYFEGAGAEENFLLISSDFAHHGDFEGTRIKDERTDRFMENPGRTNWIFAGCDNRPGIYLLASLADRMTSPEMGILYHSNSYELSGKDARDITSYFFTFLFERQEGAL